MTMDIRLRLHLRILERERRRRRNMHAMMRQLTQEGGLSIYLLAHTHTHTHTQTRSELGMIDLSANVVVIWCLACWEDFSFLWFENKPHQQKNSLACLFVFFKFPLKRKKVHELRHHYNTKNKQNPRMCFADFFFAC